MSVKTRIAPSPTGWLHIGTARTALFNYLYAKHHGGTFAVRSEDTDRERSKQEYEEEILEGLSWLGMQHDEFVRQSERLPRHKELLEQMVAEGKAYVSEEPSKADPSKTVSVVRIKNPGKVITFKDEIRGDITFDTTELGDFVIARAIDDPLYHFAVVVDDMDMGITHVIRGEDHISNTPRQILLQEALGAPRPVYAHLPLILAPDRSKLSKRHGAVSIREYRTEGFLPEAFVNFMALLGWSPGTDEEHFSMEELIAAFDLAGIQKSGAIWNREKLLSVNQRYLRALSPKEFMEAAGLHEEETGVLLRAIPSLQERAQTLGEARTLLKEEFSYLFIKPVLSLSALLSKETVPGTTRTHLIELQRLMEGLTDAATPEEIKAALMPYADAIPKEEGGRGAVLWPLRYALSGAERSPDPFTLIHILGLSEAVFRIDAALGILGE